MATVTKTAKQKAIMGAVALAQQVATLPATQFWLDFDEEADVLYISLQRSQQATRTVEVEDEDVSLRYRDKELVGITVLNVSKRTPA
jgi:uncharacterized protein YuzE